MICSRSVVGVRDRIPYREWFATISRVGRDAARSATYIYNSALTTSSVSSIFLFLSCRLPIEVYKLSFFFLDSVAVELLPDCNYGVQRLR